MALPRGSSFLRKTSNKIRALVFGIMIATLFGTIKEIIDPYMGGSLDKFDLIITFLGSVVGSVIILSKKSSYRK